MRTLARIVRFSTNPDVRAVPPYASPVLPARGTIPPLVLGVPHHGSAADRTGGRDRRRLGGGVPGHVAGVPWGHSTSDRMALANDQVEDDHDHEADDRPEERRDDEEDQPERRIHTTALGVLVHPERADEEGDDAHCAEAKEDENPSIEEHLERAVHPILRRRTRLSLFHGCPGMC